MVYIIKYLCSKFYNVNWVTELLRKLPNQEKYFIKKGLKLVDSLLYIHSLSRCF